MLAPASSNKRHQRRMTAAAVLAVLLLLSLLAPTTRGQSAEANLFSEIEMSEVIGSSSERSKTVERKLVDAQQLARLLGTESVRTQVQSGIVLAAASQFGGREDQVSISIDVEAGQIRLFLPILDETESASVGGKPLLALLAELSGHPHVRLSSDSTRLTLASSISNQGVKASELRRACIRLVASAAEVAPQVADLTEEALSSGRPETTSSQSARSTKTLRPDAKAMLVGTWSARISDRDAWAIRLDRDRLFTMVHTRTGKNSVSKGSYQIEGEKLVLHERDGITLTGKLDVISDTAFRWSLDGAATLTFNRK